MKIHTENIIVVIPPKPKFSFSIKRGDNEVYSTGTKTLRAAYPTILNGKYVREQIENLLQNEALNIVASLQKAKGGITVSLSVTVLEPVANGPIHVKRLNPPVKYFPVNNLEMLILEEVKKAAEAAGRKRNKLKNQ